MKLSLPFIVLALIGFNAHPALLIYKDSERAKVTVNAREVSLTVRSSVVIDNATTNFAAIGSFSIGSMKFYAVRTNLTNYVVTRNIAGATGNHSIISSVYSSNAGPHIATGAYFAKGRDTSLDIGNGQRVSFPRSFRAVTRGISYTSGIAGFYESSSTLRFLAPETQQANANGETPLQVIDRIRLRLEQQGYVPAPE